MKPNLKVKVSEGFDEKTRQMAIRGTKEKIKAFVIKGNAKNKAFKYYSRKEALAPLRITDKFFEFRHVCMCCGDVQDMNSYAIAQTAMGHRVNYTCECGHITILPQF